MDPKRPWSQKQISTPGMRPSRNGSSVEELFEIELFGMGVGTSSDPVCFPDPKRVRVGDSRGAVRPSLPTIYARRTLRPIDPVIAHSLPDDNYHHHAGLVRADHADYPNPHDYRVRVENAEDFGKKGCRCSHGCTWDPVTRQAEVLCRCGGNRSDEAYYHGEWQDPDKLYMRDDLNVPGSLLPKKPKTTQSIFGGNPYKI